MTHDTPPPGSTFLSYRLPVPLTALAEITDLVDRVYGTGEVMMKPAGDTVYLIAPKDGFGPRKKSRRRRATTDEDEPGGLLVEHTSPAPGAQKITIDAGQDFALIWTEHLMAWFDGLGATNYLETGILRHDTDAPEFTLTLQKRSKPTPHDLRSAAETRYQDLANAVRAAIEDPTVDIRGILSEVLDRNEVTS